MKPLSQIIRKNGFTYIKVLEGKRSYVYEQRGHENKLMGYEVFLRKLRKERVIDGKALTAGERFPNNEAFGKWAWSYYTLDRARKMFESLENISDGNDCS